MARFFALAAVSCDAALLQKGSSGEDVISVGSWALPLRNVPAMAQTAQGARQGFLAGQPTQAIADANLSRTTILAGAETSTGDSSASHGANMTHDKVEMLRREMEATHGSQFGQDRWVLEQYAGMTKPQQPYFLDLGAFDGVIGSNTHLLESQHGWHGVCVEPIPKDFSTRTCNLVQKVVHDGSLVRFRDCSHNNFDQLSGVDGGSPTYQAHTSQCPMRTFQSIRVSQLLSDIHAPAMIDYVSLDVEGAELGILQDWPSSICVRIWTIEHNKEEPRKSQIGNWLAQRGCAVKDEFVDFWATCPC